MKYKLLGFGLLSTIIVFLSCSKNGSSSDLVCGSTSASTDPIKGPSVGAHGNNSDNPFRALALHPSDVQTLYVGSEGNGIFKSTDGGANWTWLRSGLKHCDAYPEIYSLAIDAGNPNVLLAATNSGPGSTASGITSIAGVYKSADAGATWTQMNSGINNADINAAVIIPGSKFIVGLGAGQSTNGDNTFYDGGIFYASVSGTAWTESSTPTSTKQSLYWEILRRTSGLIAFGGNAITGTGVASGIITSNDNGLSWAQVAVPLGGQPVGYFEASQDLQTIYACKRSGEASPLFYKSTNGGATWTNPVAVANTSAGPVRIVGVNPLVALAAVGSVLVRTTNGFATAANVLTAANYIAAIEVSPANSNYVYVTTKGLNVYRSTDGGQTFSLRSNIRTFIDAQP